MSALINQARARVPRLAGAAVEHARLTLVPRRPQRAPRVPFVMLVSLLLVGGVAGLLTFNTSMQQSSFTASALGARASVLTAKEQSLTMQIERLRDPQQLAVRARTMGMVAPPSPAFLRLSDGKVLGRAVAATPGDAMRVTPFPTARPKDLAASVVKVKGSPKATTRTGTHGAASTTGTASAGTKKDQSKQTHAPRVGSRH